MNNTKNTVAKFKNTKTVHNTLMHISLPEANWPGLKEQTHRFTVKNTTTTNTVYNALYIEIQQNTKNTQYK